MLFNPAWKVLSWIISDKYSVQMADEDVWCSLLTLRSVGCFSKTKNKTSSASCPSWDLAVVAVPDETKEMSFLWRSPPTISHWCFNEMIFVELMFMISQVFVTLHMLDVLCSGVSRDWKYSGQPGSMLLILIDKSCISVTFYWNSLPSLGRPPD